MLTANLKCSLFAITDGGHCNTTNSCGPSSCPDCYNGCHNGLHVNGELIVCGCDACRIVCRSTHTHTLVAPIHPVPHSFSLEAHCPADTHSSTHSSGVHKPTNQQTLPGSTNAWQHNCASGLQPAVWPAQNSTPCTCHRTWCTACRQED